MTSASRAVSRVCYVKECHDDVDGMHLADYCTQLHIATVTYSDHMTTDNSFMSRVEYVAMSRMIDCHKLHNNTTDRELCIGPNYIFNFQLVLRFTFTSTYIILHEYIHRTENVC